MKKVLLTLSILFVAATATAQFKPRPDAFPPEPEGPEPKVLNMATTVAQMANWDRYPTYPVYLEMMQQWATNYPTLCHIDTIGTSIQGRLILSMYIEPQTDDDLYRPEFFYSSTMHGDEITGYVMMLRLIDTLLHGYGTNPQYTNLINRTRISINPLSNPDGTYYGGDNTVQNSRRYNANGVDLNRNYPNPFATAKDALQQENAAMIAYFDCHNFRLSANLHGGAEVMNYPWDSFTSAEAPHPERVWWQDVCRRFVDTSRTYNPNHFNDTYTCGYTAGGDWYVITGGRQDYFNYYYNCLELTMEVSTTKKLSSTQLPTYWNFLQHSLVNYIAEIHGLYSLVSATPSDSALGTVTGGGYYENGDTATLTAIPADNCMFIRWSNGATDNPLQITVSGDTSIVAIFAHDSVTTYTVTLLSNDPTMGYVDGDGIYVAGSTATLTAYPYEGFVFDHWTDNDTTNPRLVTVVSDTTLTACFIVDSTYQAGIEAHEPYKINIRVLNGCITVDTQLWPVHVYDAVGREVEPCVLHPGVYLVKVGNYPIRKLLIME